jgi:hypothetical protein
MQLLLVAFPSSDQARQCADFVNNELGLYATPDDDQVRVELDGLNLFYPAIQAAAGNFGGRYLEGEPCV